jgi:quercetin dioxygenase-like cupin family protein
MPEAGISRAAEPLIAKAEYDIKRRLFVAGMAGAAAAFASRPLLAQMADPKKTVVTPDGITRTTLENYANDAGEEFKLVVVTYPPGVGLPVHHHPCVAHNYILEGVAESQYEGEALRRFKAGDSYQDKPLAKHLIFRNASKDTPLRYLLSYTVKKGQPFLVVP